MSRYALLLAPSANRVYADQAGRLSRAELAAFGSQVSVPISGVAEEVIGGVGYLTFATGGEAAARGDAEGAREPGEARDAVGGEPATAGESGTAGDAGPAASEAERAAGGVGGGAPLSPRDIAYLSNLSSGYALFERLDDDLLRPVTLAPLARYDSDLITIPKYAGKTNEQFTRLLLNLTLLASSSARRMLDGHLIVCDPLCGRGTTLNQALMYGYDGIGVELDGKDVEAYKLFLQTYLKRKRLKHSADLVPVRRQGRRAARRLEVTMAASRDDHRAGQVQKVTVVQADTTQLDGLLRGNCADVLVADLPYGVAHGSYDDEAGMSRRPLDLLERAVPVWTGLVRPGGAIGLSWNTKVARRALAEDILLAHGLDLVEYGDLAHRVDQGIVRDVVVARKPA